MPIRFWIYRAAATGVATAVAAALPGLAVAQADEGAPPASMDRHHPAHHAEHQPEHDLQGPLSRTQEAQREEALKQVISGDVTIESRDGSQVVRLKSKKGTSKYVELGRERTDRILTVLVEFGDRIDSGYGGTPGPLHNRIAKPDRSEDNTTAWKADYNQRHFQDLYFGTGKRTESLKKYYERQSSGRYSVEGEVSDWVKVPYNEARYGNNKCGRKVCPTVENLVGDGLSAWVSHQRSAGRTDAQIKADLAEFDQWDRYDHDGDGDFNEPDGYIDHVQVVHAGMGEEKGGGAQGEDAIWSHRGYAFSNGIGTTGPEGNKNGGAEIGNTGIWAGDYTMQPENGGLGVFAHEYGHDLGLPDHYDTSGTDAENSTGYWTLMSSGSWLGTGRQEIGDLPGDMTAWDKLQLGWLDYDTAKAATSSKHKLGVAEYNTKDRQGLVVELPKKKVTTEIAEPAQGSTQWWSGSGDGLSQTLSRSVDLTGKSSAKLTLHGWWDIEKGYDYLYTEVSTDAGANWTVIDGTADGEAISRDGTGRPALDGTTDGFKRLLYPLDAYAGKKIDLRFRYATDAAATQKGFLADVITVTADGSALFSDDAESADAAWTAHGFSRIGSSHTKEHAQYYIAENRQYVSYDKTLRTGPYNRFTPKALRVEHFPYQNGLLIWKWDTSQADNNTSRHPGAGLLLPVDAHPRALTWPDGTLMANRVQTYDSPFSLYRTNGITLHQEGVPTKIASKKGVSVFNDHTNTYYDETNPTGGVRITDTNTRIEIVKEAGDGSTVSVRVGPAVR